MEIMESGIANAKGVVNRTDGVLKRALQEDRGNRNEENSMNLIRIQITLALVATTLLFSATEASASEANKEVIPPVSEEVSQSASAVSSLHPLAGYTGRKLTTNRPVSPQAPVFVSPVSVVRSASTTFRPGKLTSHRPVSPKAPKTTVAASTMIAAN